MHVFHSNCINKWLKSNNTCPTCRAVDPQKASTSQASPVPFLEALRQQEEEEDDVGVELAGRVEQIHLNGNTPASALARRVQSAAFRGLCIATAQINS